MHIIQMAQEQHAIYFGYAFLAVLGKFYRNLKGLTELNYFYYIKKKSKWQWGTVPRWASDVTVLQLNRQHRLSQQGKCLAA